MMSLWRRQLFNPVSFLFFSFAVFSFEGYATSFCLNSSVTLKLSADLICSEL